MENKSEGSEKRVREHQVFSGLEPGKKKEKKTIARTRCSTLFSRTRAKSRPTMDMELSLEEQIKREKFEHNHSLLILIFIEK